MPRESPRCFARSFLRFHTHHAQGIIYLQVSDARFAFLFGLASFFPPADSDVAKDYIIRKKLYISNS
jgi:hypothetical protein